MTRKEAFGIFCAFYADKKTEETKELKEARAVLQNFSIDTEKLEKAFKPINVTAINLKEDASVSYVTETNSFEINSDDIDSVTVNGTTYKDETEGENNG